MTVAITKERPLEQGSVGSLCWVLTNQRLIVAHASAIPVPRISSERFHELRSWGWRIHEIARMYGIEDVAHAQLFVGKRRQSGGAAKRRRRRADARRVTA